jgi:hypothetical protein
MQDTLEAPLWDKLFKEQGSVQEQYCTRDLPYTRTPTVKTMCIRRWQITADSLRITNFRVPGFSFSQSF